MTRSGEPEDYIYVASFKLTLIGANGQQFQVNPRIRCPKSQFLFYHLIGTLEDQGYIDHLTHLTAERMMFEQGHRLVA